MHLLFFRFVNLVSQLIGYLVKVDIQRVLVHQENVPLIYYVYFPLQAAELLRHPHLQPYVFDIHLKHNSPRRNSFPMHWPETNYMKKNRFSAPTKAAISTYREKRFSFGGDRTLNPSISEAEHDYPFSDQTIKNNPRFLDRRMEDVSVDSVHEVTSVTKRITSKVSSVSKNQKVSVTKPSSTSKRSGELSKNREPVRSTGNLFQIESLYFDEWKILILVPFLFSILSCSLLPAFCVSFHLNLLDHIVWPS